jgi:O-antigen/teichoic acid export membrane protein
VLTSVRDLLSGSAMSTAAARVVVLAAGVATSVITARVLQPSGRGDYFFAVTTAQLLVQFGSLGLPSSNTWLVARDRSRLAALVANSAWVAIAAGAGLGLAAALLLHGRDDSGVLWAGLLLVPPGLFYLLGGNLLVGIQEIGRFNAYQAGSAVLLLALVAAAAVLGAGAAGVLLACVAGWSLTGAVLLARLRSLAGQAPLAFDAAVFRCGLGYAQRAYLATLLGFLVLRANVFVLRTMGGAAPVGYYSVAAQFADVLAIVPQSAALVLFPALVRRQDDSFERTASQLAGMALLLGVACVALGVLAPLVIAVAFGASFLPAATSLRWMLPSVFFLGLTSVASQYLAAAGFPRQLVAVWAVGFAAVVILSCVLVPRFPVAGAPAALSAAHALVFALVAGLSLATRARRARAAQAQVIA